MDECQQQKHTQHVLSKKTEFDYLHGRIKNITHAKISPKMMNPKDLGVNVAAAAAAAAAEEEEEEEKAEADLA